LRITSIHTASLTPSKTAAGDGNAALSISERGARGLTGGLAGGFEVDMMVRVAVATRLVAVRMALADLDGDQIELAVAHAAFADRQRGIAVAGGGF
jgi:hypothetical protein